MRNYREYATLDKSEWGPGAWQDEPDKVQWIDDETGLDCLLHRGPGGYWCGYVGVDQGHPWHGVEYSECASEPKCEEAWCGHSPECLVEVHGGLTFSDSCAESDDESEGICHVAEDGRPDHVWWFGFDCGHSGDFSPKYAGLGLGFLTGDETYKGRMYVEGYVRSLAKQLEEIVR
jgi:hypothetical protein